MFLINPIHLLKFQNKCINAFDNNKIFSSIGKFVVTTTQQFSEVNKNVLVIIFV